MIMKKLMIVLAAAAALLGCGKPDDGTRKFTVGFDADFPPYGFKDGDTYKPNTTPTTAQKYWRQVSGEAGSNLGITEENLYNATNFRLRNVSLSYGLPKRLLSKGNVFQSVRFGVSCTNVAMIYSEMRGLDPESIFATSTNAYGFEYGAAPTSRCYVFNISLGF